MTSRPLGGEEFCEKRDIGSRGIINFPKLRDKPSALFQSFRLKHSLLNWRWKKSKKCKSPIIIIQFVHVDN
jgi:hypothetical protein